MIPRRLHSFNSFQLATGVLTAFLGGTAYVTTSGRLSFPRRHQQTRGSNAESLLSTGTDSIARDGSEDALVSLKRRKSVTHLQPTHSNRADAFSRLLKYEQSSSVPIDTGISRYDISQITR